MPSGYKTKWTHRAERNVDHIKKELKSRWNKKVSRVFLANLYRHISLISDHPEMFPKSEKKPNMRRAVLSKHNSIYYKIEGKVIEILAVVDNR